jgi:hypothetical protein
VSHYEDDDEGDDVNEHASPVKLVIEPKPDEHGNVMVAAQFAGGRLIALGFNAN